jgi:hypothetical protein
LAQRGSSQHFFQRRAAAMQASPPALPPLPAAHADAAARARGGVGA